MSDTAVKKGILQGTRGNSAIFEKRDLYISSYIARGSMTLYMSIFHFLQDQALNHVKFQHGISLQEEETQLKNVEVESRRPYSL